VHIVGFIISKCCQVRAFSSSKYKPKYYDLHFRKGPMLIFFKIFIWSNSPQRARASSFTSFIDHTQRRRARLKCDGTRAETRFSLSAKRTRPFKFAGASVQSTIGSRVVRISGSNGSNAGYTMFRGRVQDYWLPIPFACFPFTTPTVRHRVPSGFN